MIKEVQTEHYNYYDFITSIRKQKIYYTPRRKSKIRIVFVMGKTTVCGGTKIIFQHANILWEEGFDVSIVAHNPKPKWYPVNVTYIQVPANMKVAKCIPDCDIIIATFYSHIKDCINTGIAPVVYFEQGDVHIYNYASYSEEVKQFINMQFQLAPFILTVSKQLAKVVNQLFDRKAEVIHNAIDDELFCNRSQIVEDKGKYILMMGSDGIYYKGIKEIISAYELVKEQYKDLKLYWITPEVVDQSLRDSVSKTFIEPEQKLIVELYQNAEMFISGSEYESFSLPVIEAMACGCPVITVDNIGIKEYVVDQGNALIVPPHNPTLLAEKIVYLLNNDVAKKSLIDNALQTIKKFKWTNTRDQLVRYYESISRYRLHNYNRLKDWDIMVKPNDFMHKNDYIKFTKAILWADVSKIYIVKVYSFSDFSIGSWELGAENTEKKGQGDYYCYVFVKGCNNCWLDRIMNKAFDTNELIEYYRKCYESPEDDKINYYRLTAYYLIRSGLYKEALLLILEGIDKWKYCSDLYLLYAIVLQQQGDKDRLRDQIEIINNLKEYTTENYFIYNIKALVKKVSEGVMIIPDMQPINQKGSEVEIDYFADKLYENGLYEDAIKYYLQFISQDVEDINKKIAAYGKIALSYYSINDYKSCRLSCLETFQIEQPRAEACYLIGLSFEMEKRYDEAIFWYELVSKWQGLSVPLPYSNENDWDFKALLQLCLCYYEKGDHKKAIEFYKKAEGYKPDDKEIKAKKEFLEEKGLI